MENDSRSGFLLLNCRDGSDGLSFAFRFTDTAMPMANQGTCEKK